MTVSIWELIPGSFTRKMWKWMTYMDDLTEYIIYINIIYNYILYKKTITNTKYNRYIQKIIKEKICFIWLK